MADLWRKPYHVVIEIENKQCRMLKQFASIGLQNLKVVDIRSSKTGEVKHLVELGSEQAKKIPDNLKPVASRKKGEVKPTMWFESEGCEVCNTILSRDAFLVSGKSMEANMIMYSFMVPTFEAYTSIISGLEKTGHKVNVLKMGKFEPKTGILTENQERIFWVALKGGFFDYPRKIGMRELSAKLGIKPATLSETIRRGTRRLLEHHFEKESS
ncbi:MAG TPA: helix-turn-helix domain-containing protein [Candidatus Bathyarchaeia archaeon]|nr:helix-turn-helix domain-containing protein [Candidatus Bathyarchaeia archaeon]